MNAARSLESDGRVLWIGTGSTAGAREVGMLRACGHETVHWTAPGAFSAGPSDGLTPKVQDVLSQAPLERMTSDTVGYLKEQFHDIVVEGNLEIFAQLIRTFPRKVIFRCYGLPSSASERLWDLGVTHLMIQRSNLSFVPGVPILSTEAPWVSQSGLEILGSQVTQSDVDFQRWDGPFREKRRCLAIVAGGVDEHHDRQHRDFVRDAFEAPSLPLKVVSIDRIDGREPWLAIHPRIQLHKMLDCSGLLYTDQSSTFIHAYALQALILGVPIIYFAGSLLGRLIGGGGGEASTIPEAHAKIIKLAANDRAFTDEVLKAQADVEDRLSPSALRRAFMTRFPALLAGTAGTEEVAALKFIAPQNDLSPWLQAERLWAGLLATDRLKAHDDPESDGARQVVKTIFQVGLQRDPNPDELTRFGRALTRGDTPLKVMRTILQSTEGQRLWPRNRMRRWLEARP